ncbi:hypothetical protein JOC34_000605 [Virgibacillus halotolerans]|uniref:hypothetical protein n=1 Tax=Virgibacillus halotolerans TaxID=1071053 RepID=UPI001960FDA4|nr:hypothetical protein [Virgibacillus halotolerans]MBM7598248.1 hypothetical protein [Virgibacillus halotolerans]
MVNRTVEESIACNKCGNSIVANLRDGEGNFNQDLYHGIDLRFGYGSNHDLEHWNFDLCEDCLVEFVKTFKHVPSGFYLDTSYLNVEDESEEHQKLFDHWKKTGEWKN